LFCEVEGRSTRPFIHAWIVGLDVHLLSRLRKNLNAETVAFMDAIGPQYPPADLGIRRQDLVAALGKPRRYVEGRRDLWWTIINERQITAAWIKESLATLKFSLPG
jgi:hypothetical protein